MCTVAYLIQECKKWTGSLQPCLSFTNITWPYPRFVFLYTFPVFEIKICLIWPQYLFGIKWILRSCFKCCLRVYWITRIIGKVFNSLLRSSCSQVMYKKAALRKFVKFNGKQLIYFAIYLFFILHRVQSLVKTIQAPTQPKQSSVGVL